MSAEQKKTPDEEISMTVSWEGTKQWRKGKYLHREDGPAIEHANGNTLWFFEGRLHRDDGPAIIMHGSRMEWWVKGKRHREDGPAVDLAHGLDEWWENGKRLPPDEEQKKREAWLRDKGKAVTVPFNHGATQKPLPAPHTARFKTGNQTPKP